MKFKDSIKKGEKELINRFISTAGRKYTIS